MIQLVIRLVSPHVNVLTSLVDMRLDIPMCINISRTWLFDTCRLDLLEAPLWQIDRSSTKIAAEINMFQSERCGQSPNA